MQVSGNTVLQKTDPVGQGARRRQAGRIRLHRNALYLEEQAREERDVIARHLRTAAQTETRKRLGNRTYLVPVAGAAAAHLLEGGLLRQKPTSWK